MPTLFLSAPGGPEVQGVRTFDVKSIFVTGIAPDYAIAKSLIGQIYVGIAVVVFDREHRLQLEGVLEECRPTTKAGNGIQRYDLHVGQRRLVPYSVTPRVNHCGVAVA